MCNFAIMIADEWTYRITQQLPFAPTVGQQTLINIFAQFMCDASDRVVMLLRGSAGTGKTSVARGIVRAMRTMKQKVVLLAPTGRAAKVLGGKTIHRHIYRQHAYGEDSFCLNNNMHTDTLFIIDEASMISGIATASVFGSGCLLDDLVKYVYAGRNCRMMLIGDAAQLPPIGCEESPALISDYIAGYGLTVYEYDLTEVLRQAQESGILFNATMIRHMITHDDITQLPRIHFDGFPDISICPGNELIEQLSDSYYHVGDDETIVITRSNKRANIFNLGIRNQVLDRDAELCSGDQLMIVKNNYFWMTTPPQPSPQGRGTLGDTSMATPSLEGRAGGGVFLANGDRCVVRRVRNHRQLYGFHFADAEVSFPDLDNMDLNVTVILDTLQSEAPALTAEQQEQLYNNVAEDYADITTKAARYAEMKKDIYFNALQVKYAYAVTCHKAQGGQWQHVYLDQGYMTDDMLTPSYIHWLYTAFTRATDHLYLVNWPKTQVDIQNQIV